MKHMWKSYLLIFLVSLLIIIPVKSQVTIGSEYLPESGALLELKEKQILSPTDILSLENSTKGLLFPKVKLVSRTLLSPLYDDNSVSSDDKMLATGMVVYNINPNAIELMTGLYVWDSQKWVALNGGESPEAEFQILPCTDDNIKIDGIYYEGIPLSESRNNTIMIKVKVVKSGTYYITAETSPENGYYFSTSGTFPTTGIFTVILSGSGTPEKIGTDSIIVTAWGTPLGDIVLYDCKNISVTALPVDALLCENVSVSSSLVRGKIVTSINDAIIKLELNVPNELVGQPYTIDANSSNADAPLFTQASGIFTDNYETVNIHVSNGITPQKNGNFRYTFTVDVGGQASVLTCSAELSISTRVINVAAFSECVGCHRDVTYKNNVIKLMLENKDLFGPNSDAFYQVEGINLWRENSSLKYVSSAINKGADIILVVFNSTEVATYTDDVMKQLADFVTQKGKVLIYCTDLNDSAEKKNTVSIINKIVGTTLTTSDIEYEHAEWAKMPLPLLSSPITTPRYENIDLVGKNFGIDDWYNGQILANRIEHTNIIPLLKTTNKNNVKNIRAFMYENKGGFIWWGDAGPFQGRYNGGSYSTNGYTWPAAVDANGKPAVRYKTSGSYKYYDGGVWNSYVFVNVMAWAIDIILGNE